MFTSNEYIRLKGLNGADNVDIKPHTEFTLPEGKYLNLNYARLTDGDEVVILQPGKELSNFTEPVIRTRKRRSTQPKLTEVKTEDKKDG